VLIAERGVRARDPISLSAWGLFFATVFWTFAAPWWSFPSGRIDDCVWPLGHLAMLEPVVAIVVAWAWLNESLGPIQLSGAVRTLLGIALAQTAR
jgi:hypothetical protein